MLPKCKFLSLKKEDFGFYFISLVFLDTSSTRYLGLSFKHRYLRSNKFGKHWAEKLVLFNSLSCFWSCRKANWEKITLLNAEVQTRKL